MKKTKKKNKIILLGVAVLISVVLIFTLFKVFEYKKVTVVLNNHALSTIVPRLGYKLEMDMYGFSLSDNKASISIYRKLYDKNKTFEYRNVTQDPRAQGANVVKLNQSLENKPYSSFSDSEMKKYDQLLATQGFYRWSAGKVNLIDGKPVYVHEDKGYGYCYLSPDEKRSQILYTDMPVFKENNYYDSLQLCVNRKSVYGDSINNDSYRSVTDTILLNLKR